MRPTLVARLVVGAALAPACVTAPPVPPPAPTTVAPPTSAPAPATTATVVATTTTTAAAPESPVGARQVLAPLLVDDAPAPGGYRRDEWPHWLDLDGDGCDTRQRLVAVTSEVPAPVGASCGVTAGRWTSAYDGLVFTDPSGLDVDHVVPLANAHISGGHRWSTDQRAHFANDPTVLWVVSAAANRSKGADPPDRWRPSRPEVWCTYATRWTTIKITYRLTATTSERDALGRMLDTCGAPRPSPAPPAGTTTTAPAAPPPAVPDAPLYANCAAARAAGVTPLHLGEPGYREDMDGDRDGIACE